MLIRFKQVCTECINKVVIVKNEILPDVGLYLNLNKKIITPMKLSVLLTCWWLIILMATNKEYCVLIIGVLAKVMFIKDV